MKKVLPFGLFLILSIVTYGFSNKYFEDYFNFEETSLNRTSKVLLPSEATQFVPPTNDDCGAAIVLPVNTDATCTLTTTGNFNEATLTPGFDEGCNEWQTIVKDVWYKFTATATSHSITLTEDENTWSVNLQLFPISACTTPSDALYCGENILASNLVVGSEYLVRVFKEDTWDNSESDFHLCVRTLSAPTNDECTTATVAPVNPDTLCGQLANGTFQDATLSSGFTSDCGAWQDPAKDVWFEFTATAELHDVKITGVDSWILFIEIYSSCTETTPVTCTNGNYLVLSSLQPGTTYKIRLFTTDLDESSNFTVCVGTPTPPENDECGTPTIAPVNANEECVTTVDGTFSGSSLSQGFLTACDEWSTPTKDVWFKFTATASTHGIKFSNYDEDFEWDMGVEVYNLAACNALETPLSCSSDVSSQVNNLVVGNEYLIRVFATDMNLSSDFTLCINTLSPPIYVSTTDYSIEELVKEVLVGNSCLISNVSSRTGINFVDEEGNQDENGIGYFSKNNSSFEFENGIVLATSNAIDAAGPPLGQGGGNEFWLGDQDLSNVLAAQGQNGPLRNASVLEFDFRPTKADFKFDFIFASNEYGTYQCNYSDAFAFLLTDLTTNTTTNLAVIPGTNIPVSVTTIRDAQYNDGCNSQNVEYFHSYHNEWDGLDPSLSPIGYFGRTIPMQASATVVPGRTYHIKMVIADYGGGGWPDSGVDSGVFLLGGSFDIGDIDFGDGLTFENDKALCYGDSHILDTGLGNEFTFKWYRNGELIPGATGPSYTVTESGTYKVEAVFGDTDCGLEASVEIEFYPDLNKIVKDPDDIIICDNVETIDLTIREQDMISGLQGNYDFSYYPTLADLQNNTSVIANPENYSFNGQTTIFIKVVVPGENSCNAVKELLVDVLPVKDPAKFNDLVICQGYKLPALPEGQKYFTGSAATGDELKAGQILGEGIYTIYVYSSNKECFEENKFEVVVLNCIVPKGISPNGDGLNDGFDIAKYYPTSVKIFNRYGKEVFKFDKGYTNQWMGQDMSGKLLPSGTYFYQFTTEINEYTGYIQLEREVK